MKELIRRHIRQDQAHHLRRIEILRHFDRVHFRNADALGARAPNGQRRHASSGAQPRAAGTDLLDHADKLVARCERRLRRTNRGAGYAADIGACAEQRVGKRHAGRQDSHADLANARARISILHHPQHLGTAEVIDDDSFHCARARSVFVCKV